MIYMASVTIFFLKNKVAGENGKSVHKKDKKGQKEGCDQAILSERASTPLIPAFIPSILLHLFATLNPISNPIIYPHDHVLKSVLIF